MYTSILLSVALQDWERYSAHALAAREAAATLAKGAATPLHVLSVYEYERTAVPVHERHFRVHLVHPAAQLAMALQQAIDLPDRLA